METEENEKALADLRRAIDIIDDEILQKIYDRLALSLKVANVKQTSDTDIYIPKRERDILQRMIAKNEKIISDKGQVPKSDLSKRMAIPSQSIYAIFSEIVSACRFRMSEMQVGYLGPVGSFSHAATEQIFGRNTASFAHQSIDAVFASILRKEDILAVVPIENSTEGIVTHTIDLLANNPVYIVGEHFLPIELSLLSKCSKFQELEKIYSHPQPLAQSKNWLYENLPDVKLVETTSTSKAASLAVDMEKSAAIGSKRLLTLHPELNVLKENVEDIPGNTTRFIVIANNENLNISEDDITTVIVSVKDKSGALYEVMEVFSNHKINLINIVSRPSKRKAFDYFFYIDFIGNNRLPKFQQGLEHLSSFVASLKVLGSYPRGMKP